ncbi:uncharacterized protein LOC126809880 [Patella vulgata]|uniref:uncharacterized protein LOC126809880 n=1 Tax=Patella vulgata TaxID=6465 RepID=UPI00217F6687|nr:uncharacterized protein LOC126809880 [Patella vulgata]
MKKYPLLIILVVLVNVEDTKSQQDLTIQDKSKGEPVVQAVVDAIRSHCIFASDRLFLRRLALVQSNDGEDSKTYRDGYHGGIWQIDEDKYNQTQTCPGILENVCEIIETRLEINWQTTTWRDLRKPLYSGLAASLYVMYKSNISLNTTDGISGNRMQQSLIWKTLFAPGVDASTFINITEANNDVCKKAIDLAFIIDGSGSIGATNFNIIRQFMIEVTNRLDISPRETQVAAVQFSSSARKEFYLNDHSTEGSLNQAINGIAYIGSGTNTATGLNLAANQVFVPEKGMRNHSAKVALVVTDGRSSSLIATEAASLILKSKGVTVFAIGVGSGINENELKAISSDPDCTHVFILKDFSEVETIINAIQKRACQGLLVLERDPVDDSGEIEKDIPFTGNETTVNLVIPAPPTNSSANSTNTTTLVTDVSCSVVYIYASYDSTHPSAALYSYSDVALAGSPSVMTINDENGRPLYITYEGEKYNPTATKTAVGCDNPTINTKIIQGKKAGADITCLENGVERECTPLDFQLSQFYKYTQKSEVVNVANPCYRGNDVSDPTKAFHQNPLDSTKLIKCDVEGNMYVIQCPSGEEYHQDRFTCGDNNILPIDLGVPLVSGNTLIQESSAPVPKLLEAVNSIYNLALTIQTELQNKGSGPELTCKKDNKPQNCTLFDVQTSQYNTFLLKDSWLGVPNPCEPNANLTVNSNRLHINDLDPKKFIICVEPNTMYVTQCPGNRTYVPDSFICRE